MGGLMLIPNREKGARMFSPMDEAHSRDSIAM